MIDCHNHTLPGIDDGAHDMEMAMEMAQCAVKDGIDTIVCTPHHLNGVFSNDRQAVLEHVDALRTALAEAGIPLAVLPGSELHLVPPLPARILEGDALTYADHGRAALVELPKHIVPIGTETILEQLLYQKITPVIAHPERNSELIRQPDRLAEWVGWGCKAQLTAQSCSGAFGKQIQAQCQRWCREGMVHLIASDAHRPHGRAPILTAGIAILCEWLTEQAVEILSITNPRKLTAGEPLLSIEPAPVKRKSIRDLFR